MSGSWKLTLPCTRAEAEAVGQDIMPLADLDPPPVLMVNEPDESCPDAWELISYFEEKPSAATVALIRALVPSARARKPVIEQLADADWVTMSQAGLEPVQAGRFFVHTSAHADRVPPNAKALLIEAGLAFGTGQHETTTGCLLMLDRMKRQGAVYRNLIDVGTGTGLLAFAAMHAWPLAFATASDIDPISIAVTRENAAANGIRLGREHGALELAVAAGLDHRRVARNAPYDLIIANILAQPLIDLAPGIAAALAPGGSLILSGLLGRQADRVAAAYRRRGLRLADRIDRGDWPTLRMVKRRR